MTPIRTRFAPSPTGQMHVGNLRSALYEYLIAKRAGGDFIVRIEDTDQERFVEGAVENIFRSLEIAGLVSDEGPVVGGAHAPYVQSERKLLGIYQKYAEELIAKGEAYYCFCDKERLASLRSDTGSGKEIGVYDKHCLTLTAATVQKNLDAAMPYCIRQNNPKEGRTTFHDELYGEISIENSELDDMILIKSDGFPTYNFANVVDDHLMEISHVVRGNEYLSSAPKYNRLYMAFGWNVPTYIHLPMITDAGHKKLSKREGHASFEDLLALGYIPAAIVNFIALLGFSPEDNQEIFSLDELVAKFDYKRISKSPAVFDSAKLRWMNGEYIKAMDFEPFFEAAKPYMEQTLGPGFDLTKIAAMLKTRIELWSDIPAMIDFLADLPPYGMDLYSHKKMKTTAGSAKAVLGECLPILEAWTDYTNDALHGLLGDFAAERQYKPGYVMWPLRIALSGREATLAGATQIMELLGKEESLVRIRKAIAMLEEAYERI